MNDKTYAIRFTAGELAVLIDAAREHEHATLRTDLRRDHPIFADMVSIREKLAAAYEEYLDV